MKLEEVQVEVPGETTNVESTSSSSQQISFTKTERVTIKVRDLTIKLRKKSNIQGYFTFNKKKEKNEIVEEYDVEQQNIKTVLNPVSFDIQPGTITAIMGGSGSGKTTLLNTLSGRYSNSSNLIKEGIVEFNGVEDISTIRHAYVIQQDILLPQLTCYETLRYAAELRLPKLTSQVDRHQLLNEIILELGLKDCKDTVVGDSSHKGLSGGEKRRLSIGIQMLSNPSVLFLDEPTTGLDAYSAHLLVKTLKNLTKTGKSFIMSIHQPRSDIFFLFDNIVLLSNGKICYGYSGDYILPYFNRLGYQVPNNINPADYIIDISSVDVRTPESELKTRNNFNSMVNSWENEKRALLLSEDEVRCQIEVNKSYLSDYNNQILDNSEKAPFLRQLNILIRRTLVLSFRDTHTLAALLIEPIVMGLICGWVFFKPGDSYIGARTKQGVLYTSNGLQGYLFLLFEIYRLSIVDIKVFDIERLENCVSPPAFVLSRRIAKFFIEDLPISFFFSIVIYFMVGLRTDGAKHYFIFFAGCLLNHMCTISFGTLCIALSRDFALASLYGNLYYTFLSMCSGYFVNTKVMPVYVKWSKYLASIWYGFGMFCSNEFTGFLGSCYSENAGNPNIETICQLENGLNMLKTLGYPENWITIPLCAEFAISMGLLIIAIGVFYINVVDISLAKQIKSDKKMSEEVVEKEQYDMIEVRNKVEPGINVYIHDIYLDVTLKNFLKRLIGKNDTKVKSILQNVNATFESGSLNAIMGPSGSGKSSLLNFISGRISSTVSTKYTLSGEVYFDKYKIHPELIRSICSYVSQDDNNLLPNLTVRETLMFAATLRLSKSVNALKRNEVVDEIILKMGLRDCQNTPIGSENKKGISGGEKRRVSISIQLLNNPKILLLDEPTSGLDSFTASSILGVLKNLSDEGKTIIMTIHQPRSDLFHQFGTVLLLAKGGRVLFNGSPIKMVEYFDDLGFPVPELTNTADHVLDLISVNTQSPHQEVVSKERVDFFLQNWSNHDLKLSENFQKLDIIELNDKNTSKIFSSIIRKSAPLRVAYPLLCKRQFLGVMRDKDVVMNRLTQLAGMGVILALFFAPLKNNYIGVSNRLMLIQQGVTPLYFVGMLNNLCIYPQERDFFYEEYHDNVVGLESFFLLYLTIELPFEIFSSVLFSALIVMVIGLPRTPGLFFAMMYIACCVVNCGESLGILFNTIFDHVGFAMNIISLVLSVSTFMAGLMSLEMSGFLKLINWTSPLHYGVMAATNMSFRKDDKFSCDSTETNADGRCIFGNGQDVLDHYGLNYNYKMLLGVLIVIAVSYRFILTYLVMRAKLLRFNVEKMKKII